MTKYLILSLAVVMAVSGLAQAATGGGKEAKPPGARMHETKESKDVAAKEARTGADSATSATVMRELKDARLLTRLNPNQQTELGRNTANPAILTAVKQAILQSKTETLRELAMARLEALAAVKVDQKNEEPSFVEKLDGNAVAEYAYWSLAINAGEAAKNWTPELRENLTFLLTKSNQLIAEGRTVAEAMREANTLMAKSKTEGGRSVRLDLKDVNKYCK